MEYIFSTDGYKNILRTKDSKHSELSGFLQFTQEYPNETITDNFHVVRKIASKEDSSGNCYDWYQVDQYYRDTDKSKLVASNVEKNAEVAENAICELDLVNSERMSAIEDAICELSAIVIGDE